MGGTAVVLLDRIRAVPALKDAKDPKVRAVPAVEDAKDPQVAAVPVAHQEILIVFFLQEKGMMWHRL